MFDYRKLQLSEADRALCRFAVKLTLTPGAMEESDLELLSKYGFNDEQVTIATHVIGYFNYINRFADGLGVDLEEWMTLPKDEWLGKKASDYSPVLTSKAD